MKYEAIRAEIKKLSDEQRLYKPMRKQSYVFPEGTTAGPTPSGATNIVWHNKEELRHLFQAYAVLKGKERPVITKSNHEISERVVADMVEKYRPVEVVEEI